MNEISAKIGSLLFLAGEPLSLSRMAGILSCSEKEISEGLDALKENLSSSKTGLSLVKIGDDWQMVTDPALAEIAEHMVKDDIKEDLTPASVETLSLIAYLGPIAKSSIDYIRGVNCGFIIRNLMIRGLLERAPHPKKSNVWLYKVSGETIRFLGLDSIEALPDYIKYKELGKIFENEDKQV